MRRSLAILASLVSLVAAAPAASAWTNADAIPCATRAESQAFSRWGDTRSYFRVSNGGFESALTGWESFGTSIVAENEPWLLGGGSDGRSVAIPTGGSVTMRPHCVRANEDVVRMLIKSPGIGSSLTIRATTWNPSTGAWGWQEQTIWGVSTGWRPTEPMRFQNVTNTTGTQLLSIKVTNLGLGTWRLDDVYVDPYRGT